MTEHGLAEDCFKQQTPVIEGLEAEHIVPLVEEAIDQAEAVLERCLQAPRDYASTLLPMEAAWGQIEWVFATISHLEHVVSSDAWHEAYVEALALISAYYAKLGQHRGLFEVVLDIEAHDSALSTAQRASLQHQLRDFKLSGIDLPSDQQARFLEHAQALSQAQSTFEHHVLKATDAWHCHITDEARLEGLSERHLVTAAEAAQSAGKDGWLFDLKPDAYQTVMLHAKDRALREQVYKAYATRASDQAEHDQDWDNGPILERVLGHHVAQAQLLGYRNPTETILQARMVQSAEEVLSFLDALLAKSHPKAVAEKQALEAFASDHLGLTALQPWDVGFASEAMRQHLHGLDQEVIRGYFPCHVVLQGLLDWIEHLWGVKAQPEKADVWHESVQVLAFRDADDQPLGHLYLDLCARAHKRGGAWVSSCRERGRLSTGALVLPVVFLTCNFAPAVGDMPSLLTHDDVVTLFHEMGHALHHLLTTVETPSVAGTCGVAWDAVELPSQWMEQWAWQKSVLQRISCHHQTGQVLPDEHIEALLAARHFQTALSVCRQIEFALFDMHVYLSEQPLSAGDVQAILNTIRTRTALFPLPDYHRFQNSFGHIFAGGYASGYYSYLWAQVLSCDAFAQFLEHDAQAWPTIAVHFLEAILSKGGSIPMADAFRSFRGRDPSIEPLLADLGLS